MSPGRNYSCIFLLLPCILVSGCVFQENPEELDRLVKEDASFKQLIVERDQAHSQMSVIKNDLLTRKKTLDAQVGKMRGEYDAYAKTLNQKVDQLRSGIESSRSLLKRQLEQDGANMEKKQSELAAYEKTLSDVRKVLHESKGISFSKAERQKWEERVLMLSEKIRPLADEIKELKLEMRLKKQKIRFLR
jgi:chromosome segregation ATPase